MAFLKKNYAAYLVHECVHLYVMPVGVHTLNSFCIFYYFKGRT